MLAQVQMVDGVKTLVPVSGTIATNTIEQGNQYPATSNAVDNAVKNIPPVGTKIEYLGTIPEKYLDLVGYSGTPFQKSIDFSIQNFFPQFIVGNEIYFQGDNNYLQKTTKGSSSYIDVNYTSISKNLYFYDKINDILYGSDAGSRYTYKSTDRGITMTTINSPHNSVTYVRKRPFLANNGKFYTYFPSNTNSSSYPAGLFILEGDSFSFKSKPSDVNYNDYCWSDIFELSDGRLIMSFNSANKTYWYNPNNNSWGIYISHIIANLIEINGTVFIFYDNKVCKYTNGTETVIRTSFTVPSYFLVANEYIYFIINDNFFCTKDGFATEFLIGTNTNYGSKIIYDIDKMIYTGDNKYREAKTIELLSKSQYPELYAVVGDEYTPSGTSSGLFGVPLIIPSGELVYRPALKIEP